MIEINVLDTTLSKLNISTAEIKSSDIQDVLLDLKKSGGEIRKFTEHHNKIVDKLWFHLKNELQEFDDQLLCSITFYTALFKSSNEEFYLKEVLQIVQNVLETKNTFSKSSRIVYAISLCYGMFQSSYVLQWNAFPTQTIMELFQSTVRALFQLLVQETYRYTQHTFIVFKILTCLRKIYSTTFHGDIMTQNNTIKLLNAINHNWENPTNGVRNLNRLVFRDLLLYLYDNNKDIYETILNEINCFYWNKAKFLMLAEIIEHSNENVKDLISKNNWLDGLIYSLSKPGLVSAGADMYNSILKRLNFTTDWCELFLRKLLETLGKKCDKVIENFTNYWCLNTLKKFPSLSEIILEGIYDMEDSEQKIYIVMNVMKQCNKLGLLPNITDNMKINWYFDTKDVNNPVLFNLEHSNALVRMLAFDIICLHQEKSLPTETVYKHILNFLSDNVNSDCTVLRISMINSLSIFLTKLLTLFLNTNKQRDSESIQNMVKFCQNLQDFVIHSLELNGNYQRKITSVKIAYCILKYLSDVPKKKREQIKKTNISLIDFLREDGNLTIKSNDFIMTLLNLMKDPAKDVNEGVLQLLSEFYFSELTEKSIINNLIDQGLNCIRSKFFYEISCGQTMFKLIINIISRKNEIECMFKSVEDIFNFAYNDLTQEYSSKRDVVESIEEGKQLHSFLSILSIIFETSIKNSYDINISKETIYSLLHIMNDISNQFVWEEDLSTCSDFSKMSEMVLTIIKKSGVESQNEVNNTQISGLYQIVLNCLWLNVKASCELASLLVQCFKDDEILCEKCLNIIINVLETSRHKGAIEAAGATLGIAIQFLTSLPEELKVSTLPQNLLKRKLNELLTETVKMSSVTRRGAGLSIMVHRIVSNDLQKGKPLFHYFMKTLLDTCKNLQDSCIREGMKDIDNEKDLPKAIYIHLLTRIVTDSSLASDTMYYSAELAALAFDNLSNNSWQIRNASLQLYGALIPKLIGQRKASGISDETIATVGCDEFRTHSPKLWIYIIQQIQNEDYKDAIQAHSNLVPLLNVLASLAKRYNFTYDLIDQESQELKLLPCFISLLGSPIYTVRRLTAQCITNIFAFKNIYKELNNLNNCINENYLHGFLVLLLNCYKTFSVSDSAQLESLTRKYYDILNQRDKSYICKWSLEELIKECNEVDIKMINDIFLTLDNYRHEPGVSLWANRKITKYLASMAWKTIPQTLEILIKSQEFAMYSQNIISRIEDDVDQPRDSLIETVKLLLSSDQVTKSSEIWRVIYCISLKIELNSQLLNFKQIKPYIQNSSYNLRYMIPVASRILVKEKNDEILLLLSESIFSLSNPEKNDVDMRSIAVMANNEFGNEIKSFSDDVIINVIKTAAILLQDEDEDVRNLCVKFYENVEKENKHPSICLNKILNNTFLKKVFKKSESSTQKLCTDLYSFIDTISLSKEDKYNPFSNESKNIYLETKLFRATLQNLCKTSI